MEQWADYIKPELLILVPVLYILGIFLKESEKVDDRKIPLYLGLVGIGLSLLFTESMAAPTLACWVQAVFVSITQGVLLAGMAVYSHQVMKQSKKLA